MPAQHIGIVYYFITLGLIYYFLLFLWSIMTTIETFVLQQYNLVDICCAYKG